MAIERWNTLPVAVAPKDLLRAQPQFIEIEDTGDAHAVYTLLHSVGRVPRGVRIVNLIIAQPTAQQSDVANFPCGSIYMHGNTTATVISTADTWTKMLGTTTYEGGSLFDMPSNNRIRYLGSVTTRFLVGWHASIETPSATDIVRACLYLNGGVNGSGECTSGTLLQNVLNRDTIATSNQPTALSAIGSVSLAQNDYLEMGLRNVTDTDDITVRDFGVALIGANFTQGAEQSREFNWYRLPTDDAWTDRQITLRFTLPNARVLLEIV